MFIYSYDTKSESAAAIKSALGIQSIKHEDSKFKGNLGKLVINWGSTDLPREVRKSTVLNSERSVMNAVDKLRCLMILQDKVRTVPWSTSLDEVGRWLTAGGRVFARTKTKGFDGDGIVEVTQNDFDTNRIPRARLFTLFIPSEREYRVTCSKDEVIGVQRKVRLDVAPQGGYNDDIKTTGGGYGFKYVVRGIPADVVQQAMGAVEHLGLHFGGVDVLWDGHQAYVLEVNSAPHMTPRLVEAFVNWVKKIYG